MHSGFIRPEVSIIWVANFKGNRHTQTHTDPPRTHNTYTDIDTETNRHTQTYPPHTHTQTHSCATGHVSPPL